MSDITITHPTFYRFIFKNTIQMPSFAGKLELLLESYDQSKRTPAYKELNAKYKALKRTHAELLLALTSMNHSPNRTQASEEDTIDAAPSKQRKHRSLRKSRKDESNIIETFTETDEDLNATSPASLRLAFDTSYLSSPPELKAQQSSLCNRRTPNTKCVLSAALTPRFGVLVETEDAEEEVVEVFVNNAEHTLSISGGRSSAQPIEFAEKQPRESHKSNRSDDSGRNVLDENATEIQELLRLDEVVQVNELELETPFASEVNLIQNDANIKYELPKSPKESVIDQIAAEIIAENSAGICDENEIDVDVEEIEVEETEETVEEVEEVEIEETEEEEAGVYEIEINGTRYFTTNEHDGIVYEAVGEDDVGDEIGKFVKGKLVLL